MKMMEFKFRGKQIGNLFTHFFKNYFKVTSFCSNDMYIYEKFLYKMTFVSASLVEKWERRNIFWQKCNFYEGLQKLEKGLDCQQTAQWHSKYMHRGLEAGVLLLNRKKILHLLPKKTRAGPVVLPIRNFFVNHKNFFDVNDVEFDSTMGRVLVIFTFSWMENNKY